MYKTYGELSTISCHFEYCPVVIARFDLKKSNFRIPHQILFKLSLIYLSN